MIHLKEIREKKHISQRELSKLTGINTGNISRIENDAIVPENITIGTLMNLCKALNIKLEELIDLEEL